MKSSILFLSDGYLRNGTRFDATRQSFIAAMPERFDRVGVIKTNDFYSGTLPKSTEDEQVVNRAVETFNPDLVLSINGAGLSELTTQWCQDHGVPIFCWYWDTPELFDVATIEASLGTQVFHACKGYADNRWMNGRGTILPFSGARKNWIGEREKNPDRGIVFLGTCWHILRYAQALSVGLKNRSDGQVYRGPELYSKLLKRDPNFKQDWESLSGIAIPYGELFNALASIRRARILSAFRDLDLHIYGDWDWQIYLWPVAPELVEKCHVQLVTSQKGMSELMQRHRVSLNVFHLQNRMGGPNFRILDSATHSVAILSDYNEFCAKLFPESEAALYFKNEVEAQEKGRALLSDYSLREKLTKNANALLLENHSHERRLEQFAKLANISTQGRSKISDISLFAKTMTVAELFHNEDPQPAKSLEETAYFYNEMVHLPRPAKQHSKLMNFVYRTKHLISQKLSR